MHTLGGGRGRAGTRKGKTGSSEVLVVLFLDLDADAGYIHLFS